MRLFGIEIAPLNNISCVKHDLFIREPYKRISLQPAGSRGDVSYTGSNMNMSGRRDVSTRESG
jgi:hypothetical protein